MPQTLLLRLPSSGEEETEWVTLDEGGGESSLTRQRGSLTLAAAVARSAKVVVLAPASQILLAEPELPPGSGAKLARAVPFALEEQLTEDIDQLSFAVGRRRPLGGTPVAVVSLTAIRGWLSELAAAGLEPQAVYPDISLMPENPGQTVLWFEGARLAVRRPGALPFAVELSPVKEALVVAGVIADPLDASPQAHIPESALLYITRDDWARTKDEFEALVENFASLKVQLLTDGPLPWLSQSLSSPDLVNLLQGEFARSTDYGASWRKWRFAATLAAALLLVHVAAQALQLHHAKRDEVELDNQMAQVFSMAMPSVPTGGGPVRDARRQMQSRLDRIRKSGSGPQYFLRSLQALSGAVTSTPQTSIDALSYREESMDLKVTAPNLAAISQVSQYITKQGMSANIQSSTPVANGVEAHLQVRAAPKGSK
jgi:general secretion pathway protein L